MIGDIDIENLRMGRGQDFIQHAGPRKSGRRVYNTRTGELFLKGPIPRKWLQTAGTLPGKALHVAIELWFYAGLTRSKRVPLNLSRMKQSGVSRDSARRGLRQLEEEALVTVVRHAGRKPIVTILIRPSLKNRKGLRPPLSNWNGNESSMKGESP